MVDKPLFPRKSIALSWPLRYKIKFELNRPLVGILHNILLFNGFCLNGGSCSMIMLTWHHHCPSC